jgi:uncharacterized membrane protein YidH (DUF202 family)
MPGAPHTPFDPGLQPERTLLAWRRTAAALAVISLTGARVLADLLQGGVVVAGGVGLAAAGAFAVVGQRRHRRFAAAVARGERPTSGGGLPFAVGAALVALCGLCGGLVVVALHVRALSPG